MTTLAVALGPELTPDEAREIFAQGRKRSSLRCCSWRNCWPNSSGGACRKEVEPTVPDALPRSPLGHRAVVLSA